ncbi:hypothetical protein HYDPIDRAFT_113582 [Hydnomerulius pinastri MD-312]|uniref:Uncharacterized protein n=1 Tax=Hydnomerulius pinastri MD-312 TaxID=994086 RepID=A0A0C9VBL5_9AGAM|nr:hypothetical protein HYDPIDRAFT_113582 [Hydnomerulius pinastri MD-312]
MARMAVYPAPIASAFLRTWTVCLLTSSLGLTGVFLVGSLQAMPVMPCSSLLQEPYMTHDSPARSQTPGH